MKAKYTAKQAFDIAVAFANIGNNRPRLISMNLEGEFYHILIQASFLEYEFYVDSMNGVVAGISTTPNVEQEVEADYIPANDMREKKVEYTLAQVVSYIRMMGRKMKNA